MCLTCTQYLAHQNIYSAFFNSGPRSNGKINPMILSVLSLTREALAVCLKRKPRVWESEKSEADLKLHCWKR